MQCYQRKTIRASKIFKSFPKKTIIQKQTLSMLRNCTECNVISAQSIINLSPMADFFIEVRHFTPRCISDERSLMCIKGSDNYNYHVFIPVKYYWGHRMQLILFVLQKKCIIIPTSFIGLVHVLLLHDIYYAQITFICSTYG